MRFAVNYSTKIAELVKTGKVEFDLFKCPEWDALLKAATAVKPVYLHLDISLGSGQVEKLDFDTLKQILVETGTPHVNCHLSGTPELKPGNKTDRKKLLRQWIKELEVLKQQFAGYLVISENLPFRLPIPEYHLASDADLISRAINETDTGLLLDISHARITADTLGINYQDYVEKLPLDRLHELHITGVRSYHGFLEDHFEMQPEDWPSAEWAAEQIRLGAWRKPEIVAFEYGGVGEWFSWRTKTRALEEQVPRLYGLFGGEKKG
jgi:Uncharacterized protein conserved in bacteria